MSSTVGARLAARESSPRLLAGAGSPLGLDYHVSLFGRLPRLDNLVELVDRSGLRGRGGAGFPTGAKLAAVARASRRAVVVANGVEGEPPSAKDRTLLRVAPNLVLDGAILAADAVGAREVLVGVSTPSPELAASIAERMRRGGDRIRIELARVPNRFVAGEETALLRALEGRPARPTVKPPFPAERGLRGAPTLVQNVETLAHIALIARFGPEWFGSGTALVTLGGAVSEPGVYEIPLGSTLADVLAASGGVRVPVAAYLVGGYFGRFVAPAEASSLVLTPDQLGAGAIIAVPASTCAVAECARAVRWLAGESAGQCGPCIHGLGALADAFDSGGRGDRRAEVARIAGLVDRRGACRHPDGVARLVGSALEVFADEFAVHARRRGCGRKLERVLPVPAPPRRR